MQVCSTEHACNYSAGIHWQYVEHTLILLSHFLKSIIPAFSSPISSSTTFHVCSTSVFCVSVNALGCCSRAIAVGRSQVGMLTAAVSIFLAEQAVCFRNRSGIKVGIGAEAAWFASWI